MMMEHNDDDGYVTTVMGNGNVKESSEATIRLRQLEVHYPTVRHQLLRLTHLFVYQGLQILS